MARFQEFYVQTQKNCNTLKKLREKALILNAASAALITTDRDHKRIHFSTYSSLLRTYCHSQESKPVSACKVKINHMDFSEKSLFILLNVKKYSLGKGLFVLPVPVVFWLAAIHCKNASTKIFCRE